VIPYGRQSVDEDDIAAVTAVLRGDWLTTGPAIEAFEAGLCEVTGAAHAVAFANGTAALHAAAAAAGLGPGDRLAAPGLTFSASAACGRYVGATPVLVDTDEATYNLDVRLVPAGVEALVAVDYAGLPVDLSSMSTAQRPRVVIEDASHALGARTADGPVGGCGHADMTTFSFHPVKPITTAEGGAVTTNDDELADRLRRFRNHGIEQQPDEGGWYYEVVDVGFNYRLTDIQAALGLSQLRKLDAFIARRNEIAARYRDLLADLPVELPPAAPDGWRHGYHLFVVRVADRRRVFDGLRAAGIGVQVHYVPMHHHPVYADCEQVPAGLPVTERVYEGLLSLPIHPSLTDEQQDTVVDELRRLVG
jgi:UDP-4-amino-4,6-dideoxy-N-acetyl-beta-L-altrosamine transaminase